MHGLKRCRLIQNQIVWVHCLHSKARALDQCAHTVPPNCQTMTQVFRLGLSIKIHLKALGQVCSLATVLVVVVVLSCVSKPLKSRGGGAHGHNSLEDMDSEVCLFCRETVTFVSWSLPVVLLALACQLPVSCQHWCFQTLCHLAQWEKGTDVGESACSSFTRKGVKVSYMMSEVHPAVWWLVGSR